MPKSAKPLAFKLHSTDFDELREAFIGWDHQWDRMSAGEFDGDLLLGQFGPLQIMRVRWGNSIRFIGVAPPGTYGGALTFRQATPGHYMGRPSGQNDALLDRPDKPTEFLTGPSWEGAVICSPDARFSHLVKALSGGRLTAEGLMTGTSIPIRQEDSAELRTMSQQFFEMLDGYARGQVVEGLTDMALQLERRFALAIVQSDSIDLGPPPNAEHERLVALAEHYVDSFRNRSVGIVELCDVLGISERWLHMAFTASRGVSPAKWLRMLRFNKVYRSLRAADPARDLVRTVVLDNGFHHLGRFSADYRAIFGENPSETLNRV